MNVFRLDATFSPLFWVVTGIIFFLILENYIAFRPSMLSKFQRWRINFSMQLCNLVAVDLGFVYLLKTIPFFSGSYHFDLWAKLSLNSMTRIVATVLIFDLVTYFWHRINHEISFLWRFHRVHHTDLNLDVSSAARFHFIEITISTIIMYSIMLFLGASIIEMRIFNISLALFAQFCHSNIRLWKPLEQLCWWVIVPPAMHRIHHSDRQQETDSNYGTILSIWDRLFGTFQRNVVQEGIVFGLKEHKEPRKLMFLKLLALPFTSIPKNNPSS